MFVQLHIPLFPFGTHEAEEAFQRTSCTTMIDRFWSLLLFVYVLSWVAEGGGIITVPGSMASTRGIGHPVITGLLYTILASCMIMVLFLSFFSNYKDIRNTLVSFPRAAFAAHVLARSPEFLEGRIAFLFGSASYNSTTWLAFYLLMWLTCASLLFIYPGACGGLHQSLFTCVVGLMLLKGRRSCHAVSLGTTHREFVPLVASAEEACARLCHPLNSLASPMMQHVCNVACLGPMRFVAAAGEGLARQLTSHNCCAVHGIVCTIGGFVLPVLIKYLRELVARKSWALQALPAHMSASGLAPKELAILRWSFGVVSACFLIVVLPIHTASG
eukprot:jgi/Botrbrau1/10012/Bobra.0012s0099.1